MTTFSELGLDAGLVTGLAQLGYEEPTPIQQEAIPALLAGRDLLGQAATGTGKTAAFALPLLQRWHAAALQRSQPQILVLVPTRELAMQVAEAFHRYGRPFGTTVVPIYGGQAFDQQIRTLRRGVHVVVATPGRALDHLRRKTLDLSALNALVLDEADEMLDMGFAEDLDAILAATPAERQTALFSATLAPRIAAIAEKHLDNPVRIAIARPKAAAGEVPKVRQQAYLVARPHKVAALGRILDLEGPALALIFCRTRTEVDTLTETLNGHGYRGEALHGGMTQDARDRVMKRARAGKVDLLIATDVAARGLDIEKISHVINFNVPESPAAYVHRIGRTGRAGREGVAITLVEPREHRLLKNIESATRQRVIMAQLPTAMDVQAKRVDATVAEIRELLGETGNEVYRSAIDALSDEFDPRDVAAAAMRLAHDRSRGAAASDGVVEETNLAPVDKPKAASRKRPERTAGLSRIYIGAGKKQNLRPTDLVGAIVNEAKIDAAEIGSIEITDRFSLVEIPEERVNEVVRALRSSTIKGKKLTVRRDLAGAKSRG